MVCQFALDQISLQQDDFLIKSFVVLSITMLYCSTVVDDHIQTCTGDRTAWLPIIRPITGTMERARRGRLD